MIIFISYAAIHPCNASNKGEPDPMDRSTAQIVIKHFTKREKREVLKKVLSIKGLWWFQIHGSYKVVL
jgi:hypothetical protein